MLLVRFPPLLSLEPAEQGKGDRVYSHRLQPRLLKQSDMVLYCLIIYGKEYQLFLGLITLANAPGNHIVDCVLIRIQSETLDNFLSQDVLNLVKLGLGYSQARYFHFIIRQTRDNFSAPEVASCQHLTHSRYNVLPDGLLVAVGIRVYRNLVRSQNTHPTAADGQLNHLDEIMTYIQSYRLKITGFEIPTYHLVSSLISL